MRHRSAICDSRPRSVPEPLVIVKRNERDKVLFEWLELLDSPVARKAWDLYSSSKFDELVRLSVNPQDYTSADLFRRDYAAARFFSKCSDLKTSIDKTEAALTSAREAEHLCSQTNAKFRDYWSGHVSDLDSSLLFRISQVISDILGPLTPQTFRETGWSKGRTSSVSGADVNPIGKYRGKPDATLEAIPSATLALRESPHWGQSVLNADGPCSVLNAVSCVRGNTLITVPKNAKTDRTICYEPHMNIRLQLAVGDYLRHRLLKFGVNLSDQSINQRRAIFGSKHGTLATIDLSSASDTISRNLVLDLLPLDWFEYLDKLRSKYTLWPDGIWRENEKFSSMGNGYTFELESLLFYAICSVVSPNVSVFGDDIILPSENYDVAVKLLNTLGFRVNAQKSFSSGPFRESCGMDVFSGFPVTPVYLRSLPKRVEDIVHLHNEIRRWCASDILPDIRYERVLAKWRMFFKSPSGPSGYGDGHYHVDLDRSLFHRAAFWLDAWSFRTYVRVYRYESQDYLREGEFPYKVGPAALCAALGPKRTTFTRESTFDRRRFSYKKIKALANFCWPEVQWT
jgi:hypothetical protein